jgi:hypothetical protein
MRKQKRAAALFLVLALMLSFVGCDERGEGGRDGIYISEETPYSETAMAYAEETFFSVLLHYAKKSGLQTIPPKTQMRLRETAKEIAMITAEKPVQESIYLSAMDEIRLRGASVIDELSAFSLGESTLDETRTLYLSLTRILNPSLVMEIMYRLLVFRYDYLYEDAKAKYEQYGYAQHKQLAQTLLKEKTAFTDEIGADEFCAVLSQALVFADLFAADALSREEMAAFTDAEILLFLKSTELAATEIGDGGWCLILEKILPESGGESFTSLILAAMRKNGDYKNIAPKLNDVTALIAAAHERLTNEEIAFLRAGENEAALQAVMKKFTESDFVRLAKISETALNKDEYHALALSFYGADYASYAAQIQPIDLQTLRASLEDATFYESLERYIAGISPAFSYGMRK